MLLESWTMRQYNECTCDLWLDLVSNNRWCTHCFLFTIKLPPSHSSVPHPLPLPPPSPLLLLSNPCRTLKSLSIFHRADFLSHFQSVCGHQEAFASSVDPLTMNHHQKTELSWFYSGNIGSKGISTQLQRDTKQEELTWLVIYPIHRVFHSRAF